MKFLQFFVLGAALASAASAYADLYAVGQFNGWDCAAGAVQFTESEANVYSLEIDFSKGTTFKISTVRGTGSDVTQQWTAFDSGSLNPASSLTLGVPALLQAGVQNIEAPANTKQPVLVNLNNMTITIGEPVSTNPWSGTLPVLFINTQDAAPIVSKEEYLVGTCYLDPMGLEGVEACGTAEEPLTMKIKGRGNYSWTGFDKKPYRLKLDKKTALYGMNKSKNFALLAHADDNVGFLRNATGFEMSRRVGLAWTPADKGLEVVLNGEYIGLYFLTETIAVAEDRVNVTPQEDLAIENVDGGWLVELDNYDSDPHITVKSGDWSDIWFTYKSPEVLSSEQEQYLQGQMDAIDRAIFSSDKSKASWADYLDITMAAKFYIVQELLDNYESYHGSCYLHREQGADNKWIFGPVWDFGSAYFDEKTQYCYEGRPHSQHWIGEMCKFPEFMTVVKNEWSTLLGADQQNLEGFIDNFVDKYSQAAVCDAIRWPQYGNADMTAKAEFVKGRLSKAENWLTAQWLPEAGVTGLPQTQDVHVYVRSGMLVIDSREATTVTISDISGRVMYLEVPAGESCHSLPRGMYIVGSQKVLL